jgi:PAS domain S-box-containing protein
MKGIAGSAVNFKRTVSKILLMAFATTFLFLFLFDYLSRGYLQAGENQRRDHLKQIVQISRNAIEPVLDEFRSEILTSKEATDKIRDMVRRMTFSDHNGNNYIFMSSYDGTMLVQPYELQKEMTSQQDLRDAHGVYIIQELISMALKEVEGGYVSYYYPPPGSSVAEEKISFVLGIPELNCYIGAGQYMGDLRREEKLFRFKVLILESILFILLALMVFTFIREIWSRNKQLGEEVQIKIQSEAELREKEHFISSLINAIPTPVFYKDRSGAYQGCNNAFSDIMGISSEEIKGKTFYEFWPENQEDHYHQNEMELMNNPIHQYYEHKVKDKDGNLRPVIIVKDVFRNEKGDVAGLVGAFLDISEQKLAEEELRHYQEHLEELVSERTIELEKEKNRAEMADKAKSEFLANMSHELRTPLNAVIGFSELLSSLMIDEKQQSYANSIRIAGKSLLTLINDILDLSKIEAGMMEIKTNAVSIRSIIREIEQIFTAKTEKKGLDFIVEIENNIPETLLLDEARIRQIFLNLVGNAEKFTEEGYIKIALTVSEFKESSIGLIIRIEDSGIGIEPQYTDRIFDAFIQKDGLDTRKYGGTGLGLAICKKMVKAMDGDISVKSNFGAGTVFEIVINDIPVVVSNSSGKSSKDSMDLTNTMFDEATILVVDDIESSREIMKEMLSKIGFNVLTADNGKIALQLITKCHADLVFMDIMMPIMDGLKTITILKSEPQTAEIPVIAMTASSVEKIETLRTYGFDGYLSKPFKVDELINILSKFFHMTFCETDNRDVISIGMIDFNNAKESSQLINLLIEEILPVCLLLKDVMVMGKIEKFGEKIIRIGEKHDFKPLVQIGCNLIDSVKKFDTAALDKTLLELAERIKQLVLFRGDRNGR